MQTIRSVLMISLDIIILMIMQSAAMGRLTFDFESDLGGIPWDTSAAAMEHNTEMLANILNQNASYNALVVPDKVFHFYPGIYALEIVDFHLYILGTLRFHRPPDIRVTIDSKRPDPCIWIQYSSNILITSLFNKTESDYYDYNYNYNYNDDDFYNETGSGIAETEPEYGYEYGHGHGYGNVKRGVIDGYGSEYWGVPLVGYVQLGEFRPNLLVMSSCSDVVIEYMIFKDAPLYTLYLRGMYNLKIRYTSIVARRTSKDGHGIYDLSAFNTDGIDVSGQNVHVHDVDVWNQDDCIAVKDGSADMLFERITASGLGLTVGSIGGSTVQNITFKDSLLHKSYKGIHMKFREGGGGLIKDVTFQNITIVQPEQWGIWIGPAQQSISGNVCYPNPCSLCWPAIPFAECNGILKSQYRNITLRDVRIYNPLGSPGVILGHESNPIDGLLFHNVRVYPEILPSWLEYIDKRTLFPGLLESSPSMDDKYMQPGYGTMYIVGIFVLFTSLGMILSSIGMALRNMLTSICSCNYSANHHGVYNKDGTKAKKMPLLHESIEDGKQQMTSSVVRVSGRDGEEMMTINVSNSNSISISNTSTNRALKYTMGLGLTLLAVYLILRPHLQSMDVDAYFTCEGATNATATGDTWPIPSCFEDETDMDIIYE